MRRMIVPCLAVLAAVLVGLGRPLAAPADPLPRAAPHAAVSATIAVGSFPLAIGVNPATNTIYVANNGGGVSVINGASNTVAATIATGANPGGIAVDAATNRIYVANFGSDSISVINGATNAVSTTVHLASGSEPFGVAVNAATNTIYVAEYGTSSLAAIDGNSNTVNSSVTFGGNPRLQALAVNTATNTIYAANTGGTSVFVASGALIPGASITVGSGPDGVAVDTATDTIYVANSSNNSVSVINGASGSVSATVAVGRSPQDVAVDAATDTIFVTNSGDNSVSMLAGGSNAILETLPVGNSPAAVAVNVTTNTIYVANEFGNSVSVLSGPTDSISATIPTGDAPQAVVVNAATNRVYVAGYLGSAVPVINGEDNSVALTAPLPLPSACVSSCPTSNGSYAVAMDAATNEIYVANYISFSISIIDEATNGTATYGYLGPGNSPTAIAVDAATNTVYVANAGGNSVYMFDATSLDNTGILQVGASPQGIALDSATDMLYVTNANGASISLINGATRQVLSYAITVGSSPLGVAVNAATNLIYVADNGASSVSVIDGATNGQSYRPPIILPAGSVPGAVAVDATRNLIYVTDFKLDVVYVIDGVSNRVIATVAVGAGPSGIAVNEATNTVYVSNYFDSTVSVIAGLAPAGAPASVLATAGDVSATVQWQAPASNGGSAIRSYSVVTSPPAVPPIYVDGDATLAFVPGLHNGQSYSFTVTAINALGAGPASAASNSVMPVGSVSGSTSTVAASPASVVADGSASTTVTVTLRDAAGDPVAGKTVGLAAGAGSAHIAAASGVSSAAGVVMFTATDTKAEAVSFSAIDTTDSNLALTQTAPVSFVAGPVSSSVSTATASPGSADANGISAVTVTVTLLDAFSDPVAGKTVSLRAGSGSSTISAASGPSNAAGQVTFGVTDTIPESVSYTATDLTDNNLALKATASVSFDGRPADAGASLLGVSPPSVAAGNSTGATVTVTLRDDAGQPVSGKAVTLTQPAGKQSVISSPSGTSDTNGVVSFTVTDATAETVTYSAMDATDRVSLSATGSVSFTKPCIGCALALQAGSGRASPGGSLTASVQAQAPSQGLGSWVVNVAYDPTLLTPTACISQNSACSTNFAPGIVQVVGTSTAGLQGSQTLAQVTFAASGPTATSSQVTVSASRFSDSAGVAYAAISGSLLVVVGVQGDVNLDGQVSATDALCVLRLVAGLPATTACPQNASTSVVADVNADGKITATDALCVLREVARLAVTAACPSFATGTEMGVGSQAEPIPRPLPERKGETGPASTPSSVSSPSSPPSVSSPPPSPSPRSLPGKEAGGVGSVRLSPSTVAAGVGKHTTVQVEFRDAANAERVEGLTSSSLILSLSKDLRPPALDPRPLGAWTVDLRYDMAAVQVVSCTSGVGSLCNPTFAPGVIRVVGASASGLSGDLALASITFERLSDNVGISTVSIAHASMGDSDGQAMALDATTPTASSAP